MIKHFSFLLICALLIFLSACDSNRVYEDYKEFNSKIWLASDTAVFDFQISDTTKKYNLKFDVRNSMDYPVSRLFVNYQLSDKGNINLSSKMISGYLFELKTGKPLGSSGIGDIYDNQFPILQNHTFQKAGNYRMKFSQMMRVDSLRGILAVGLRVEQVLPEKK